MKKIIVFKIKGKDNLVFSYFPRKVINRNKKTYQSIKLL